MRARLKGSTRANSRLLIGVLAGMVAGVAILYTWVPEGPTKAQIATQRSMLQQIHAQTGRVLENRRYHGLAENWKTATARLGACGLDVAPEKDSSQAGLYQGPAQAWHASVQGAPSAVVACYLTMPESVSLQPAALSLLNERMTLWFSVIGRPSIGITQ